MNISDIVRELLMHETNSCIYQILDKQKKVQTPFTFVTSVTIAFASKATEPHSHTHMRCLLGDIEIHLDLYNV